MFEGWCAEAGCGALPASPETVRPFVAWALEKRGFRLETVKLAMSAVSDRHRADGFPSPVDASVRGLIANAARVLREGPGGKSALTPEQLRRMSVALGDDALALRDRSILLLGFALGWRRSELVLLGNTDVKWVCDPGVLISGVSFLMA